VLRWNRKARKPTRRSTRTSHLADRQMTDHLLLLKLHDQFPSSRVTVAHPNSHYLRSRRRNKTQKQSFPGSDRHLRLRGDHGYQRPRSTVPAPSLSPRLETGLLRRLRSRLHTNHWAISCPEAFLVFRLRSHLQLMNRGQPLPLFLQDPRNHDRSRAPRRNLSRSQSPHLCLRLRNLPNSR